jgi:hypothetical protein
MPRERRSKYANDAKDTVGIASQVESLSSSLAQKATKGQIAVGDINKNLGKFDQTYLSDELLQQMAGSTPVNATPADYSITTKKLTFEPIMGVHSKNLYNKNDVFIDTHINGNDGTNLSLTGYYASDFIPISASANYTVSGTAIGTLRVAFYNSSKQFISKIDGAATFTSPLNTSYARISISSSSYLNTTQLELGETATSYDSFRTKFSDSVVDDGTFDGKKIKNKTINPDHLTFIPVTGVKSKNLFNKNDTFDNTHINGNTGADLVLDGYRASNFIVVEPNKQYTISGTATAPLRVAFYDASKVFLSKIDATTTFTTPLNTVFVRVSGSNAYLDTTQLELGGTSTSYSSYGVKINPEHIDTIDSGNSTIYKLNDAWVSWLNGEKFPIAFYGDSTFDGYGTTGFQGGSIGNNNASPNAFAKKAENFLRTATNNNILRVYNAGFTGQKIKWGLANIDAEFTGAAAYNDTKMMAIGFGINDRLDYQSASAFRNGFKADVIKMIQWCYEHNIQPFLVTSQALLQPNVKTEFIGSFPLRTTEAMTIVNEVKRELAKEYNLELIDLNYFTGKFLNYSSYPANVIIPDQIHFGDIGHNYEAGVVFSHISPRTIVVKDYTKIDYSSQCITNSVADDLITLSTSTSEPFKAIVNYTKADSADLKIMNAWLFINTKKKLTLKAYRTTSPLTYVKVNGTVTTLANAETILGQLEMGLYQLEVFTGASTSVDFKGFILE